MFDGRATPPPGSRSPSISTGRSEGTETGIEQASAQHSPSLLIAPWVLCATAVPVFLFHKIITGIHLFFPRDVVVVPPYIFKLVLKHFGASGPTFKVSFSPLQTKSRDCTRFEHKNPVRLCKPSRPFAYTDTEDV